LGADKLPSNFISRVKPRSMIIFIHRNIKNPVGLDNNEKKRKQIYC